ncbi:MAG: hypothetical protein ACR2PT_09615, partial [Endozoicomonas sp.]
MKLFKPFPVAGTFLSGTLFFLVAGLTGQKSSAMPMTEPSTTPPATVQPLSYTSCNDPDLQGANRTACQKHFKHETHINGIKVIPHNLTQITRDIIDGTELPSNQSNQTLYIFESIDAQGEVTEYDLWSGFKMPSMSTFAGNLDSGQLPRLTTLIENTDPNLMPNTASVITAESSTGDYWLADLEVDSGGDHSPQTVLKLGGARSVSLNNVTVVRDPAENIMGIRAIELGCRDSTYSGGNPTPRYEIIDSEIDLTLTHPTGHKNPGDAITVKNCEGAGRRADLRISNTLVVIDDRTSGSGDSLTPSPTPESSGSVFFINGDDRGNHTLVNFLPGSTCNRVENIHGEDISSTHMGLIQGELDDQLVIGVVGLSNGNGWGWDTVTTTPVIRHGNTYYGILRPADEWYAAGRCDDLSCNDPMASTTVTIPSSLCQMTSTIEPTSTLVASTSAGTGMRDSSEGISSSATASATAM